MDYNEVQSFLKNRLMFLVLMIFPILLIFFLYGLYQQVVLGQSFGNQPMSNLGLLASIIALSLLFLWFLQLKLVTQVSNDGVSAHFSSLGRYKREIPFDSIQAVEVVSYNGLTEHGGWGWRVGPFGKAFTVYGNQAVKLTLKGHKTTLTGTVYIGTQNPYELAAVIENNLEAL